jgi:hypothetical protein
MITTRSLAFIAITCALPSAMLAAPQPQTRCGWFLNPTPQNVWLYDGDGQWTISIPGEHQAEGDWPQFKDSQWVYSGNASYGYGCACMRVVVNAETSEVDRIVSARARPLAACRQDPRVRGKEPKFR